VAKQILVKKAETPKAGELQQQEAIVYLFICTRLDAKGLFSDSDQYVATAVMQGQRKTVERTITRLIAKKCLAVVEKTRYDAAGGRLPDILRPLSPKPIWGNRGGMDKKTILSIGSSSDFVQGSKHGQVPDVSATSAERDSEICPPPLPPGRVHKNSILNTTGCVSVDVGSVDSKSSTVQICPPPSPKKLVAQLKELRDELAFHEKAKNSKRIRACKQEIMKLEAELTLARNDGGNR
jgi:uncharacterized protein YfcZ (UPF0381/DUF406 family)